MNYLEAAQEQLQTQSMEQTTQQEMMSHYGDAQIAELQDLNQIISENLMKSAQEQIEALKERVAAQESLLNAKLEALNVQQETEIKQSVQIQAEFPNATDSNEIQKALESLVNAATQHAYDTKR